MALETALLMRDWHAESSINFGAWILVLAVPLS